MADKLKLKFEKTTGQATANETKFDYGLVTFEEIAKKREEQKLKDLKRQREYVVVV